MKRFLVFVIICIVTLSLGLTTYYFLRDNEVIVVLDSYFEKNVGDVFEVNVERTNANPNKEPEFKSLHPHIVDYNPVSKKYMAVSGGRAVITVDYDRADFKTVSIEVVVGDGTTNAPFFVSSIEDILFIGKEEIVTGPGSSVLNPKQYDKAYRLKTDLDFAQLTNLDPVQMQNNGISPSVYEEGVWVPIGNGELAGEGFSGNFDFNGHTIYNMSIIEENFTEELTVLNAGLFATLEEGAVVKNLNLENVNIQGNFENIGSVAAINYGTVETTRVMCGNIDNLMTNSNTGGIVGKQEKINQLTPRVDRSYSSLTINGGAVSGGLVGHNYGAIIINSYSQAQLTGNVNTTLGGIVGLNQNKEIGVANEEAVVKDTYYYGIITSQTEQKGAIIGQNINKDDEIRLNIIRGNYYSTEISGDITGIGGIEDSELNEIIGVFDKSTNELKTQNTYYSYTDRQNADIYWEFNKTWQLNSNINNGLPTLDMGYPKLEDGLRNIKDGVTIQTVNELINMSMTGNYVLDSDLDLSYADDWIPIGYNSDSNIEQFTGTITVNVNPETGKFYVIKNLTITSNRSVNGLFAHIGAGAELYGITIENVNITAGKNVGAIAGINDGTISNATITLSELLPNNGISAANTTGEANAGGIAGISNGTIQNSSTHINIDIEGAASHIGFAGGLAGSNYGSILNSYSTSSVYGNGLNSQYIGGLAGSNNYLIESSYFLGNISASAGSSKVVVGGLAGTNTFNAEIKTSFVAEGTYQAHSAGGLVGINSGLVTESYTDVVNIKARYAGGLAFNIKTNGFVNCYTLANLMGVDGNSVKGGFAYYIEYQNASSYGRVETSFSAATFDTVGTNYGETAALVRTEGLLAKRQAGYIIKSIYDTQGQSLKEQNYLIDFINTEWLIPEGERKIVVSTSTATGGDEETSSSFKVFRDTGFIGQYWNFVYGSYPTLKNVVVREV